MAMRRQFWEHLRDKGQPIPPRLNRQLLLKELSSHLGDPDPRWRDDIAFALLGQWIYSGGLNDGERRLLTRKALLHLSTGLGRKDDDSVFLRSFSVLILCCAVERDLIHPFLSPAYVRRIFTAGLRTMAQEQDLRGFIPKKGWAHAVAHLADLLDALAKSPNLGKKDLQRILRAIAKKLRTPSTTVLGYGEPVRLARAVTTLLDRKVVPGSFVGSWIASFSRSAEGRAWSEVLDHPDAMNARTNVILFLSALVIMAPSGSTLGTRTQPARSARKVLQQFALGF
jgi:hypothetical protein